MTDEIGQVQAEAQPFFAVIHGVSQGVRKFIPSSPRQLDALTCLYPIFPLKHWNRVHTIDGIYLGRTSQTLDDLNGVIQKNGQMDSENRVSTTFDDSSSFSA